MSDCKVSDQVYSAFDEMQDNLVIGIEDTISAGVLPPEFKDRMNKLTELTMNEKERQEFITESDTHKWKSLHKPNMTWQKNSEPYTNLKEGLENIEVVDSIRQAINSRHLTFSNTPTFKTQCQQNANIASKLAVDLEEDDIKKLNNYTSSNLNSYNCLL